MRKVILTTEETVHDDKHDSPSDGHCEEDMVLDSDNEPEQAH